MFQLPEHCVAVLSEQQWVSQQGREPTGGDDPAADAFAEGMTQQLERLRMTHPSYARLCTVFEIGLALQLVTEATGQPSLQAWFPSLCAIGSATPEENVEPKTVEGLTTWHRLKNGTVVAVVSGGVKVDARSLATSDHWQPSKFLVHSLVPEQPERPSSAHGRWWWDQRYARGSDRRWGTLLRWGRVPTNAEVVNTALHSRLPLLGTLARQCGFGLPILQYLAGQRQNLIQPQGIHLAAGMKTILSQHGCLGSSGSGDIRYVCP